MNKELLSIADEIRQNCNFLTKNDEHLYNIAKSTYLYLYESDKQPNYLIRLCALIVKKYKKTTPEVLEFSKKALIETQHPDSVVYYCKSLILNKSINDDTSKITEEFNELKKLSWKNNNARTLVDIFEACFHHSLGDYAKYTEIINNFNEKKPADFNPYISIPVSSVYRKETIDFSPVTNNVIGDVRTKLPNEKIIPEYCISVSCNKKYFDDYGKYLIDSLKKLEDQFYCHISITDSVEHVIDDSRFSIINQNISSERNIGPISSSLRFIHALDLLEKLKVPVIVLDFDCVILDSPKALINLDDSDVGMRILENTLPWEKYTGGMSIYINNDNSIDVLIGIRQYLMETITSNKEQWWIDQNALEIAIRSTKIKHNLKIKNIFREIPKHIYIPTGTKESKILQMERAIAKNA